MDLQKFIRDLGALREILLCLFNSTEIPSQSLMVSSSMAIVATVVGVSMHEDAVSLEPMLGKILITLESSIITLIVILTCCLDICTIHLRMLGYGSAKGMIHELLEDIPSLGCL